MGAAYAKERVQFGRVIAMYQAVKHHCANMVVATELATSAVWDAARAAATGGDQLTYAAAVAATLAAPAADLCANLNTQVHGGIAITWEHDAHLYMRRATTLLGYLDADEAAADLVDLTRRGVERGQGHRAAARGRGDPRPRSGPSPRASRACPPTSSAPSSSRPATSCRTGPSPTAARPAPSSSSSSSRSSTPAGIKRPAVRHHGVEHPHAHPVRQPGPARPLGAARR